MSSSELDYITIRGFKSIAAVEKLPLRPINIVIGANGSGKSNFIGIFSFLHSIRDGRLQDYVAKAGGAEKVLHFGSKITPRLEIEISFRNQTNKYRISLSATDSDELYLSWEDASVWDKTIDKPINYLLKPASGGRESGLSSTPKPEIPNWVYLRRGRWSVYHFHDTSASALMKKTGDLNDNMFLRPDAANLAAFLYLLKQKHATVYSMILRTVQQVAPFIDDFLLEPSQLYPDKIRLEWRHRGSEQYFDGSSLSDGTLRFIALVTLLLEPDEYLPPVILVDEPELGLHPKAITLLASLIKMASTRSQVIVSTQSPLLLDHFSPEDVLVADRVDGGTQLTRLDPDRLTMWLQDYSLGQLWEKNELGGRPSHE